MYPSVVLALFIAFVPRGFEGGVNATTEEYFLAADLSIPYYSEFHLNYRIYAGVMIALWPLGVPLWMVRYFLRNRKGVIAMANAELRAEYKLELDWLDNSWRDWPQLQEDVKFLELLESVRDSLRKEQSARSKGKGKSAA